MTQNFLNGKNLEEAMNDFIFYENEHLGLNKQFCSSCEGYFNPKAFNSNGLCTDCDIESEEDAFRRYQEEKTRENEDFE